MYPEAFSYHAPSTVEEALALLERHGDDAKLLAGGHSLLPAMKLRLSGPTHIIDMKHLRGSLDYIRDEGDDVAIGALTTHRSLERSELLRGKLPVLAETAGCIGDMQVRNLGTLGGSVAHADPAGDLPAAVLALDAVLVAQGSGGTRTIAAGEFFHGFFETALEAGEILIELRIPTLAAGSGSSYQKFFHPASGYAVCGAAAVITPDASGNVASCRVALTGVSEGAYRATAVEEALVGKPFSEELAAAAAEHAADGIEPLEDYFADATYRGHLAKTFVKRALLTAWERSG
ncbi:MAG: xanthine dehydrogenase family protein subunit M [Trueperaceae bacterium]|nr:MAG: xanthine dehydrogenase family protein subunit M [Trueperaceae bacterium]